MTALAAMAAPAAKSGIQAGRSGDRARTIRPGHRASLSLGDIRRAVRVALDRR